MQNAINAIKSYQIHLPSIDIAVTEWGCETGTPVIALHGWLDNMSSFYPIVSYSNWVKQQKFRLITIDWPGHGHSAHRHSSDDYQLLDYVRDLHDLIKVLKLDKVIILAHSLGGSIATLFAGSFPEIVDYLVLIEGLGPMTQEEKQGPLQLANSIRQRNKYQNSNARYYQSIDQLVKARQHDTDLSLNHVTLLIERNMRKTSQGWVWRSDPRLRLASPLMLTIGQVQAFIDNLSMPVLLLYGQEGFIGKYPQFADLIARNPQIETLQLEGGHHLHMAFPKQVIDAFLEFVIIQRH